MERGTAVKATIETSVGVVDGISSVVAVGISLGQSVSRPQPIVGEAKKPAQLLESTVVFINWLSL
jgi:hypothetical protein